MTKRNRYNQYQRLFAAIRNGILTKKKWVRMRYYIVNLPLIQKLLEEGIIVGYIVDPIKKQMSIQLNYTPDGECVIRGIILISYRRRLQSIGISNLAKILQTSTILLLIGQKSFFVDREALASGTKKGGELLCVLY